MKKTYSDGSRYVGGFKWSGIRKLRHGRGTLIFSNGDNYDGEWKNDNRDGKGIWIYGDNKKYVGEWKNDKRDGKGTLIYSDGTKYEGEWKNDVRIEKRTATVPDNKKSEGELKTTAVDPLSNEVSSHEPPIDNSNCSGGLDMTNPSVDFEISADDLEKASHNKLSFDSKYKNKIAKIHLRIFELTKSEVIEDHIVIKTFNGIACYVHQSDAYQFSDCKQRDSVTIIGRIDGLIDDAAYGNKEVDKHLMIGSILLKECIRDPSEMAKQSNNESTPDSKSKDNLYCSFCGKSQDEVSKLIAGPHVYICDECIQLCVEIFNEGLNKENDSEHLRKQIKWPGILEYNCNVFCSNRNEFNIDFITDRLALKEKFFFNPFAFDEEYRNMQITLNGMVRKFSQKDDVFLATFAGYPELDDFIVKCYFNDKEGLSNLKSDDFAIIGGIYKNFIRQNPEDSYISLEDCKLIAFSGEICGNVLMLPNPNDILYALEVKSNMNHTGRHIIIKRDGSSDSINDMLFRGEQVTLPKVFWEPTEPDCSKS